MARLFISKTKSGQVAEVLLVNSEQKPLRDFGGFGLADADDFVNSVFGSLDLPVVPGFNVLESRLFADLVRLELRYRTVRLL
jgi:hypothetical protein